MSSNKVTGIYCYYSASIVEIPYDEESEIIVGEKIIYKDAEDKEECGVVRYVNRDSSSPELIIPNSGMLRRATLHDLQKMENYLAQGDGAVEICKKLIDKHELAAQNMEVFRGAYSFDGSKVHFMFTADDRVDFRELVKDLAKALKKQIYLRQVGPRDKAKLLGGYGKCGRQLCCYTFLNKLESINMEMVREQFLESKGSSKLSGCCGKLLCCLKYEVETYRDLRKLFPEIGSTVRLTKASNYPQQVGDVVGLDVLNSKLKVILESGAFTTILSSDVEKVIKVPTPRRGVRPPVPSEVSEEKDSDLKE